MRNKVINLVNEVADQKAVGFLNEFKDNSDPKYIGPGYWDYIHRFSFNAKTIDKQKQMAVTIREICNNFPCKTCSGHCKEYIEKHPPEDFIGLKMEIYGKTEMLGMFVWSWKFHNTVNIRLNKPLMSWETAYNLYSYGNTLACGKNCAEAGSKNNKQSSQNIVSFNKTTLNNSNKNSYHPRKLDTSKQYRKRFTYI